MEVSVCNGRVIKSCMDPIPSLWRAGIAIEKVYPPHLPPWLGFVVPQIEISQESQPTLRFALLWIDAMEVSVCNCRVIKSCTDPISSLWRAGIAIEMVYPPQLGLCTREKNLWLVGFRVPPVPLFWWIGLWVYTRHPCQFSRVPGLSTGRVCVLYN